VTSARISSTLAIAHERGLLSNIETFFDRSYDYAMVRTRLEDCVRSTGHRNPTKSPN